MRNLAFMVKTLEGGGAQRVMNTLSVEFIKRGIAVHIITMFYAEGYRFLPEVGTLNLDISRENRSVSYNREKMEMLKEYIRAHEIDTLIIGSTSAPLYEYALFVAEEYPLRIIAQMTNAPERSPVGAADRRRRDEVFLELLRRGDGFLFQTEYERDYFPPAIREKSAVIDNPLMQELPDVSTEPTEKLIVSAGRYDEQKNFELLIQAFHFFVQNWPDYRLMIFGKGHMEGIYRKQIRDLNLEGSAFLLPFTIEIHEKIRNAAAFVQSSNYEGVSNMLLEAIAMGIPVISTDCPAYGARSFIRHSENGLLVPPGRGDLLAKAIEEVVSSEDYKRCACQGAAAVRRRLDVGTIVSQYIQYIDRL